MNQSLAASVRKTMEGKSTEELKKIYIEHDESRWSPRVLEVIYQMLSERGEIITPHSPTSLQAVEKEGLGTRSSIRRTLFVLGTLVVIANFTFLWTIGGWGVDTRFSMWLKGLGVSHNTSIYLDKTLKSPFLLLAIILFVVGFTMGKSKDSDVAPQVSHTESDY